MTHRELAQPSGSMSEFPRPAGGGAPAYTDACGCNANTDALAALRLAPQSEATQTAIRNRDIKLKWFTVGGGQTLDDIHSDLLRFNPALKIAAYVPYSEPGDWSAMLPLLRKYAGIYPCVIQLGQAHNLSYNEGGVQEHFVLVAGYDDTREEVFKILNGDDVLALGWYGATYYTARWVTLANLISADVQGLIVPEVPGASMGIPAGWKDSAGGDPSVAGVLTAPNGVQVVRGFRVWVLNSGWDPNNLPLVPEAAATPCNPLVANSGAGVNQLFDYLLAVWQKSSNQIGSVPAGQIALHMIQNPPAPVVKEVQDPVGIDARKLIADIEADPKPPTS